MPVYVYETIPVRDQDEPEQFEIYQSIHADALSVHPDTKVPIRRIITGGMSLPKRKIVPGHSNSSGASCCEIQSTCPNC